MIKSRFYIFLIFYLLKAISLIGIRVATQENFLEKMKDANEMLDKIQKELNNYLETKRAKFARFYFLSNDQLLHILSQVKEVERVQEHLRKIFENINKIEFHYPEKTIHAMFSVEDEYVPFLQPVNPNNKQVEDWLGEVEGMMVDSIRACLLKSIEVYKETKRTDWIFQHPGQCVLNGSQVHWTREVEEAIQSGTIPQYIEIQNNQLIDMVRLDRGSMDLMKLITLEALVVIDVHA